MKKTIYDCSTKQSVVVDMSAEEVAELAAFHAECAAIAASRPPSMAARVAALEAEVAQLKAAK